MKNRIAEGEGPVDKVHSPLSGAAVVVYDGECAFCTQAVEAIRRRDRENRFSYLARQTPGIESRYPELLVGDFDTGMRLFEADGTMYIGADAIYRITLRLPYFRRLSWVYRLPLLNRLFRAAYTWVAANRLKLSRYCDDACALDGSLPPGSPSSSGQRMTASQILISLIVILVLGLHGWANVAKALLPSSLMGDQSWPFLAYGMYRTSYPPRVIRSTKQEIVALTESGKELPIVPETAGVYRQALYQRFVGPMRRGDPVAARLLADRMNIGRDDPVVAFRLEIETYAITHSGVVLENTESEKYFAAGRGRADDL